MKQPRIIFIAVVAIIAFVIISALSSSIFHTIQPGKEAILFERFGGGVNEDKVYEQGFHIIAPWNELIEYDVRINEEFEGMSVLSKNGLTIDIDLSYRFKPSQGSIGKLHNEIGPNYLDNIIKPEIRSATREVIGKYLPEELYSTKREAIQEEIEEITRNSIKEKYLELDAVLIREVALPDKLKGAIEQKLEEEQLAFQYEFKLERERKEAERKIIEAQAKADANQILNASLTDKILKDKGIEATLELSESPNSKVIIIGSGEGGLPLILGDN